MSLKFKMDDVKDLSDDLKSLYTKGDDGKFYLTGVKGISSKEKTDEFRENNIDLMEKLKKFDNINIEEYKALLAKSKSDDDKQMMPKSEIDKQVEARVKDMREGFETEKTELTGNVGTMQRQLESLLIDNSVRTASAEHGVLSTAIDDVIFRAKATFKVENGKVVGYDGDTKLFDASGENLLNVNTWVEKLGKSAPHLFSGSNGGNMQDGGGNFTGDRSKMSSLQKIQTGLNP